MALAPIVAAALNVGLPTRTRALWIDGLDVLKQPGSPGNLYGAPIEDVQMTEAGPGQVSSLRFVIDDPQGVISVPDAGYVLFMDITRNMPIFAGFVESATPVAMGIGRSIEVTCCGVEKALDWMYYPGGLTFIPGDALVTAAQAVIGQSYGAGVQLRTAAAGSSSSTQTVPGSWQGIAFLQNYTVPAGSLRQVLQGLAAACMTPDTGIVDYPITVDFYHGLRAAAVIGSLRWAVTDYVDVTISDAAGRRPADTQATVDSSGATRQVYVQGGNAAGTGIVGGNGKPGPIATLSDTNSTTEAYKQAVATQYLARNGVTQAGSVRCEENTNMGSAGFELRAGVQATITDPNLGMVATVVTISQIDKEFLPNGLENWTFGWGATLSGSELIRRLTRTVLNN